MQVQHRVERPKEIPCVVLPIMDSALLLPNASVAEIFSHADLVLNDLDHWCIGWLKWRGLELPAISFERLSGCENKSLPGDPRAVVMNGILGDHSLPFYCIVVKGLPRLVRLTSDDFQEEIFDNLRYGEVCRVKADGENLIIPNLDLIEQQLIAL